MGLDYYGILAIHHAATPSDIQRAYRRLALQFHPLRCDNPKKEEIFYHIAEAYDVLSSHKYKSIYDQYGEEGLKDGIALTPKITENVGSSIRYTFHGDPYKVFREFFGVDNPFAELKFCNIDPEYKFTPILEEPSKLGPSKTIEFTMTLEDIYSGCVKIMELEISIFDEYYSKLNRKIKTFEIKIPKGCEDKRMFTFKNAGDRNRNMIPGDITFVAKLQPHNLFKKEGNNLVITKTILLPFALLGCVIDITTLDNKTFNFPLINITKPNDRIEFPNEGLPIENSNKKGNLIVVFEIEFPGFLNATQRKLLETAFIETG